MAQRRRPKWFGGKRTASGVEACTTGGPGRTLTRRAALLMDGIILRSGSGSDDTNSSEFIYRVQSVANIQGLIRILLSLVRTLTLMRRRGSRQKQSCSAKIEFSLLKPQPAQGTTHLESSRVGTDGLLDLLALLEGDEGGHLECQQ